MSRKLQPRMMFMSGSCHCDDIYDFGQFLIFLHNFFINVITWDVNSLLRDAHFLHIKFLNREGMKFNLTIECPPLHPFSTKFLICNVETEKNLRESLTWSIKQYYMHDSLDCGQPNDMDYEMDFYFCILFCLSFLKVVSMILLQIH